MAWIIKHPTPPAYSERAVEYHQRREKREGFKSGFVLPSPEWQLIKMAMIPPILREGKFFYMDFYDYTVHLVKTAREIVESRRASWGFVRDVAVASKKYGLIKDPPLILASNLPSSDMIADVLEHYPPPLIVRFIDMSRKADAKYSPLVAGGLGRRKKRGIEKALLRWGTSKWEIYVARYPQSIRDILRVVHPKPPTKELEDMWGYVVGKKEPPTEMLRFVDKVSKMSMGERNAKKNELVEEALSVKAPFETVRSIIGFPSNPELLKRVFKELATPITAFTQLSVLAGYPDIALEIVDYFGRKAPLSYMVKALFGLAKSGADKEVIERIDKYVKERGREVAEEVFLPVYEGRNSFIILIDVSGSMEKKIWDAVKVAYTLSPLAKRVLLFSSDYPSTIVDTKLETVEDALRIVKKPSGMTPLEEAIEKASRIAEKEDAVLLVFTDEQGNVFKKSNIIEGLPVDTIVFNVAPYPTEHIVKEKGRVIGLPSSSIETAKVGLRLLQFYNIAQTEAIVPEKLVEILKNK